MRTEHHDEFTTWGFDESLSAVHGCSLASSRTLMLEMRPRFESISDRTRRDIQAALTPDQQNRFIEMSKHAGPPPD